MSDEFLKGLERLRDQSRGAVDIPIDTPIYEFIQVSTQEEFIKVGQDLAEGAQRGPEYYAMPHNYAANPDFEEDLTGWTQGGGGTGTTSQQSDQDKTHAIQGSLGSLEIDATLLGSTILERYQDIPAAEGQVWNLEAYVKGDAFTGSVQAHMILQWHTSGGSLISQEVSSSISAPTDFTRLTLENKTAPATTATLRVVLRVYGGASGGTGKAYFDVVRAEEGLTALIPLEEAGIADLSFAA